MRPLLGSARLQYWQLWHLIDTRKRKSEAGSMYFDKSMLAECAWAEHKWRPRLAFNVQLNKLSGGTNPCSATGRHYWQTTREQRTRSTLFMHTLLTHPCKNILNLLPFPTVFFLYRSCFRVAIVRSWVRMTQKWWQRLKASKRNRRSALRQLVLHSRRWLPYISHALCLFCNSFSDRKNDF